jgi:hypothetical protein
LSSMGMDCCCTVDSGSGGGCCQYTCIKWYCSGYPDGSPACPTETDVVNGKKKSRSNCHNGVMCS